jgi:UDP-N-acetylmuramoyl-tripeptide--D-alanyl-D-alanine ligase
MKRSLAHFSVAMRGVLNGKDAGFGAVSTDTRTIGAGELFFALTGENFDGHDYVAVAAQRGAAGAVVAKEVAVDIPQIVVDDPLRAMQRAAQAWRAQFRIPVVAVAGSNGKTTTKEMIASVLAVRGPCLATRGTLNNHIGVPLTLLGLETRHASAVIEIGANHPGEVAALVPLVDPTVGVVTNAGAEHLEGFGSLIGVARAEGELFASLRRSATAVINADDTYAPLWRAMNVAANTVSFGVDPAATCRLDGPITEAGPAGSMQTFTINFPVGKAQVSLNLAGRHNVQNALGAAAVGYAVGISPGEISEGLGAMRAVRGRLEVKRSSRGAWIIDDSYNANPSSLVAGLDVLAKVPGERWLVLGEMAELGDVAEEEHRKAGLQAREAGVTRLFTLGKTAEEAAATFGSGAEQFSDRAVLSERVGSLLSADVTVLVKGSRLNRLEKVVESLVGSVKEA